MNPNSTSFIEVQEAVMNIINTWDPMSLIKYNRDEYQSVVDEILEKIDKNTTLNSICRTINKSFIDNYGPCFNKKTESVSIAQSIYDLFHKKA